MLPLVWQPPLQLAQRRDREIDEQLRQVALGVDVVAAAGVQVHLRRLGPGGGGEGPERRGRRHADAFDFTFYLAYDESWRIVATFRLLWFK